MKKYKETHVEHVDLCELDLGHPFYENGGEERNEVETTDNILCEVPAVKIQDLIEILVGLQMKGADYVYIAEHIDHHGYELDAVKLEEIT